MDPPEQGVAERRLQVVQRLVVADAFHLGRHDSYRAVLDRRENHVGRVDKHHPRPESDQHLGRGCRVDLHPGQQLGHALRFAARCPREFASAPDRARQALLVHRLEHVVRGVHLEGFDRVLVVRGSEYDMWQFRLAVNQFADNFQPAKARHFDVEEHDVRFQRLDPFQCARTVRGLVHDADLRERLEQEAEFLPRQSLVVDEQRGHHAVRLHWVSNHAGFRAGV